MHIGFGQDREQAGKSRAQHLVRTLGGFTVDPASESGDKLIRFGPFSSQCRAGNVKIFAMHPRSRVAQGDIAGQPFRRDWSQ